MRRLTILLAFSILIGASAWTLGIQSSLTCTSLGVPEGALCPKGRIEFAEHGPWVFVREDDRRPVRLGSWQWGPF
jgi:hypothetical protein